MSARVSLRHSRGFALMLAVFMIVTLAAIGLYLVTISTGQIQAVSQDEQSVRAYQAARAGIDWGAYQLLQQSTICTPTQTRTLTQGLAGFYAVVACQQLLPVAGETEGPSTVKVFQVVSTGCNANPCAPATPDTTYVERQLQLRLTVTTTP